MKNDKTSEKSAAFFSPFFRPECHLGGWKFQGKPEILFRKYVSVWPDPRKCQGRQIIGKSVFFCGNALPFRRHFLTLIAPRRLKISRYTRNSILKIVFTMVGRPKMPREVRNGRFLQIAPIWTVTAKLREMASVKIWKNAVFRFGGSPRSFWHTSCSGLFLRESRLPKKCTVMCAFVPWG